MYSIHISQRFTNSSSVCLDYIKLISHLSVSMFTNQNTYNCPILELLRKNMNYFAMTHYIAFNLAMYCIIIIHYKSPRKNVVT